MSKGRPCCGEDSLSPGVCDLLEGFNDFKPFGFSMMIACFFFSLKRTNFIILSLPFRKLLLEPVSVPCGHTFCGALRKRGRSARLAAHVYSPASRCQPLLRSGLLESGLGLQELITKFVTRMEVKSNPPQLPCSALQECLFGMPSTSASRASRQYTNPPAS